MTSKSCGGCMIPSGIDSGLMGIFKTIWATCFFEEMYIDDPITYEEA
jgi:hypothetical protein